MNDQGVSDPSARLQGAVDFLRHVLPREGAYIAYVVDGERKFNQFCSTVEGLAYFILQQDAYGKTVYHACSSFRTAQHDPRDTPQGQRVLGRTQRNVLHARSLWADLDCGDGKPYPTQLAGAERVVGFLQASGLPAPIYVGSGNGLHLYWPLDEALDPETWRKYAAGLAQLLARHGLHVDTTRTQDLSSVLRTPGTHHRKSGLKEVIAGPLQGPYPLQLFERLLNAQALPLLPNRPRQALLPAVRARSGIAADLLGGLYGDQPARAEAVARDCRQVGSLRENPSRVTEPLWHAALGVLAHCDDGRDSALEWTDPDWRGAVEQKLERLEAFGPTTCAKFASLNPGGCVGCPHSGRITSPIQLGRNTTADGRVSPGGDAGADQQDAPSIVPAIPAGGEAGDVGADELPTPPTDFVYDADGKLQHQTGARNGGISYDLVCTYPIYLKAIQTAELDEGQYGYVFREKGPRQAWRDVVVTAKQAIGRDVTAEFAQRGVIIHDGELWRKYVRGAAVILRREKDVERRYDQFGWKDGETSFLVGKRLYTSTSVLPATGSPTLENRAQYLSIQNKKGASLERWQAAANKLFAAGLEHQSLAVLCGFAAPLMRFHAEGEGGAIVSFVSDRTASGKTTALEAAASIWGQHKGLKLDETDTRVAKGLKLGVLGNLPCTFDELHQRDPELIREFVLTFTNGTDKDRGTAEGGLKVNKAEWQTILLTASNTSLVDKLSNMDSSDAPAARILELVTELPRDVMKEDFEEIRRELNFNHGFAGHEYLKTLVQPEAVEWIRSQIPVRSAALRKAAGLDEKHRFWVRLLVSVTLAGEIVERLGIVDFKMGRLEKWLVNYVAEGAATISGTTQNDAATALSAALSALQRDILVVDYDYKPGRACYVHQRPVNQLLARYEKETKRMYFSERALKKWLVEKGINTRNFFDTLKRQGVVLSEMRKVTLGAGTSMASGQTPCVSINMANPLVSGVAASIEEALPEPPAKTRADRIREMQR